MERPKWEYIRARESNFYGEPTEARFERVLGITVLSLKKDGTVEWRDAFSVKKFDNLSEVPGITLIDMQSAKTCIDILNGKQLKLLPKNYEKSHPKNPTA
jgi:hypothetical protein